MFVVQCRFNNSYTNILLILIKIIKFVFLLIKIISRNVSQNKYLMKRINYNVIEFENKSFDLPEDMPIPRIGERIYVGGESGFVYSVSYHIKEDYRIPGMNTYAIFVKVTSESNN